MNLLSEAFLFSDVGGVAGELYENAESIFTYIVKILAMGIEIIGVCIVVFAVVRAVIGIFKKDGFVRLNLAEGIALAIEFKMGGELLRTVIARDWQELLMLGAVVLLRAAMTFLLQWEIHTEKKNGMTVHGLDRMMEDSDKAVALAAKKRAKKGAEVKKGYGEDTED